MTTKETAASVAKTELLKVALGSIVVDDALNVRQTYTETHIEELAKSISKVGILRPLTVARKEGDTFMLMGGFCRVRAVKALYPDNWKQIEVPVSIVTAKTPEEILQFNIGDDESAEPPKRSEVAERLNYLVSDVGIKQSKLAERTGISQADVSKMISVVRKLHPDILEAWKAAPTRAEEIPFALLYNWCQFKPEQQIAAFEHYKAPPAEEVVDEVEVEGEGEGDGSEPKKRKKNENKEILRKVRTKREIEAELQKYLDMEALTEQQDVVRKVLEWVLSERKTIRVQ